MFISTYTPFLADTITHLAAMAEKSKSENASDKEFQVKFVTKLENLSVPDTPFTVPASVDSEGLTALVRELLDSEAAAPELDWLCLGEIVRASLQEHVDRRTDITAETVIELEYIEKKLPPEPQVRLKRGVIMMKGKPIDCNMSMYYCIRFQSSKIIGY